MSDTETVIISQKEVESGQFIAFERKKKTYKGYAYKNGSTIRVKSFEHDEWVNRVPKAGAELHLFTKIPKISKKFKEKFRRSDFPDSISRNRREE